MKQKFFAFVTNGLFFFSAELALLEKEKKKR